MCDAIVHGTHETPIPDSPMRQINGPYLMLALMAAIKSRNRISRFQGFRCRMNWTFQSPDPRFSDEANQWSISYAFFNSCDQVVKSHIVISGFSLSNELDISKSRSPILRWLISLIASADLTAISGALQQSYAPIQNSSPILRWLISLAASADLTTVSDALQQSYVPVQNSTIH
jgi:hypothetical protein